MPRFFFHIYNGEVTLDEEGRDFADLEAARALALDSARELICASVRSGRVNLSHRIEIADEAGAPLDIVRFRDAFVLEG